MNRRKHWMPIWRNIMFNNADNPYAAPQVVNTRNVMPPTRHVPENRDYRWFKRGLGSLALVLSPLTYFLIAYFEKFAVLGLSLILPFCCGLLAAVPPRTPGRICLLLAACTQAVGSFCVFVMVLMPEQVNYDNRFQNLLTIATVAEAGCYLSLMGGLILLSRWLADDWLRRLCYGSLCSSGLLLSLLFLIRTPVWDRFGMSLVAIFLVGGASYLCFWSSLVLGTRIPRLITANIPDPPRFE